MNYVIHTSKRFPSALATRSSVESLMSFAWFSILEIAVFLVLRRMASSSWVNPADSRAWRRTTPILNCS
jgi:hypothetical protein